MRGFCLITVAACLCSMASAQSTADELIQDIRNNDLTSLKARLRGLASLRRDTHRSRSTPPESGWAGLVGLLRRAPP